MTNNIGIIGDVHIGAGYNMGYTDSKTQLNTRLLDFQKTFDINIDNFVKNNVSTVVLTGDITETRHPTSAQLNILSKCLKRAINFGMNIVVNIGNHDQQRNIFTTTMDVFAALDLPSLKVYSDIGVYNPPNDPDTNIILMPYKDRRMLEAKTNSEAIDMIRNQLNLVASGLKGKKIIVGHFMLEKSPEGSNPDTFSLNELILPLDMFNDFDAVIMGHIHKHEIISLDKPVVIYSGSMDKVSFGEKDHTKVSLILDPNNLQGIKVLKSDVRNLFELNFDYSDNKKIFKDSINEKIIGDIDEFDNKNSIKNSIVKLIIRIKENDLYYVNQTLIKDHILSKGIKYCSGIHVASVNSRQLRDSSITEVLSGKQAFASYLKSLTSEPENMKKKLLKCADEIIAEVENK